MSDNKLLLRVALKLFAGFSILWLVYILLAGLFISNEKSAETYLFDISSLKNNQARYFFVNGRELLVIKQVDTVSAFWANDPIYGCRLEFSGEFIRPVCIEIFYGLDGYSKERDQWLLMPEFEVSLDGELVVY